MQDTCHHCTVDKSRISKGINKVKGNENFRYKSIKITQIKLEETTKGNTQFNTPVILHIMSNIKTENVKVQKQSDNLSFIINWQAFTCPS